MFGLSLFCHITPTLVTCNLGKQYLSDDSCAQLSMTIQLALLEICVILVGI